MLKQQRTEEAVKKYYNLQPKLEKEYGPDYYVVINPKTEDYYVGKTSVEAMKKAREKNPKGKLFLAQIGRIAGLMK